MTYHFAYATRVTNPKGHAVNTNYSFFTGQVTSATNANNFTTTTTYDSLNRVSRIDSPDGSYLRATYDLTASNFSTTVYKSVAAGQESAATTYLDGIGRQKQRRTSDPAGDIYVDTQYYICDCNGKTAKVSNPYRTGEPIFWTETQYDALGRPVKIIPPDGTSSSNTTSYSYDDVNAATTVTDPAGKLRKYEYDVLGRIWRVTEPDSTGQLTLTTTYNYLPTVGQNKLVITQGTQTRTFNYDTLGRLTSETHPENGTTSYSYDDNGNMTPKTDARGITTTYGYDQLNRQSSKTYSDGTPSVTLNYDTAVNGVGKLASYSTSNQISGSSSYDLMGRVTQDLKTIKTNPQYAMNYTYNLAGQSTSTQYPNGTFIYQNYNSIGQLSSITSSWNDANHPGTLLSNLSYSAAGQPDFGLYGNGRQIKKGYNSDLQLKLHEVKDQEIAFTNNGFEQGSGTTATNWNHWSSTRSSEKALTGKYSLKVQSTTVSASSTASFIPVAGSTTYTLSGYVYIASYTGGNIYLDLNDGIGQGQNFTDNNIFANTAITGRWQKVSGTFTTAPATTGVTVRIVHDGGGTNTFYVDELSITPGTRNPTMSYTYEYNDGVANNGRIQRITHNISDGWSQTFQYDELNRLKQAQMSFWGLNWTYDRYGNRLSQSAFLGTPPTNSKSVDANTNKVAGWTYDAAGNVTSDGRNTYAYDAENRIIRMTVIATGVVSTYEYGPFGDRVLKTSGGVTTYYYWGIAENQGGAWTKLHVDGPAGKLAEYSSGTTYFYFNNHLGSIDQVMNINGDTTAGFGYYPYGERIAGNDSERHQFTGKERDSESGNDYFGARYYWNGAGRWLGVDPIFAKVHYPQIMSRYSYALNDPVNLTDPDGRFVCGTACDDPPSPSGTGNSGGSGTGGASDLFEVEAPSPTGREVAGGGGASSALKSFGYKGFQAANQWIVGRIEGSRRKILDKIGGNPTLLGPNPA